MPLGKGRSVEAAVRERGQDLFLAPARSVLFIIVNMILDDWPLLCTGGRPRGIRQESQAVNFSISSQVLAASTLTFLGALGCHVRNFLFC